MYKRQVRHKHLAVAVGDDAARTLDRFDLGVCTHGLGKVIVDLDDLRVEQRDDEHERAEEHHRTERNEAAGKAFGDVYKRQMQRIADLTEPVDALSERVEQREVKVCLLYTSRCV